MHHSYQLSNFYLTTFKTSRLHHSALTICYYSFLWICSKNFFWHQNMSLRNSSSQLEQVTPAQHTHERVEIAPQKRILRTGWVPQWCITQLEYNIYLTSVNAKFGKSQRSFPSPTPALMLTPFITRHRKFPSWLAKFFASSVCYKSLKTKHYI